MTSRGRNYQNTEWDSTRDDYSSSVYDNQYQDDSVSADVNLDHCRLYIKNVPKGLNEEGLRAAFAKFGTLLEVHLSKDPQKSYGLVRFETPGEAKLAMMKMNRTEPLKLAITIAYKSKSKQNQNQNQNRGHPERSERNNRSGRERNDRNDRNDRSSVSMSRDREDSGSVLSHGKNSRMADEVPNGDNNMDDLLLEDDYGFSDILDPNLHLELESLKLEQLKVREEQLQVKQRVILLKQAERRPMAQMSNRCILPDGKIVVRNNADSVNTPTVKQVRFRDSRDADVSFSAGAGDSFKMPALQRIGLRQCVVCGAGADSFCAGCGITPYCSERCQRRDWTDRHSSVCHNLARTKNERANRNVAESDDPPVVQPAQPLRRPHLNNSNARREIQDGDNSGFVPKTLPKSPMVNNNNSDSASSSGDRRRLPHRLNQPRELNANTKSPNNRFPNAKQPVNQETPAVKESVQQPKIPSAVTAARKANGPKSTQETASKPDVAKREVSTPEQQNKPESPKPDIAASEPQKALAKKPNQMLKPASVSDVTPTKKLVPKKTLLDSLKVGDTVLLTVESKAADARSPRGDFVCMLFSETFNAEYTKLCEDFILDCDRDGQSVTPTPGETISYFNPEDNAWYRGRCLTPTVLALLDSGKIVTISAADKLRKLPNAYEDIPEFSAVLTAKGVKIGTNIMATITSQVPNGFKVSMKDVECNAALGDGELARWLANVEYAAAPTTVTIPTVPRPDVTHNTKVFLVHATSLDKVFVRPADTDSQLVYNEILQRVLLSGDQYKLLKEPPQRGQLVIAKFTDGNHYRAFVQRTNAKLNKYMIEYVEFGNVEVNKLETLYQCPEDMDLENMPPLVSMVKLSTEALQPAATEAIEQLKDEVELVLTLNDRKQTAPSGSQVTLTRADTLVNVNNLLVELCTPEWKKIEKKGEDIINKVFLTMDDLEISKLPPRGCTVTVLDTSMLNGGVVCGYDSASPFARRVHVELAEKMAEYCESELGKEPYLPRAEELCIAKMPPYPQWFRAIFLSLTEGPGSSEASVCYVDYGNVADVPVNMIRKMIPDFVKGYPTLGLHINIRGFPEPTDEALMKALVHMKIDEEGRGSLKVTNCIYRADDGTYEVDAPELLAAMSK
ncbi:uncharacterized protein LOC118280922 isoform X4 [Spodoptera frugiperda]|uniref:Uncharacterized protein LOC118280922 isoform X4 n=1 Tax=Spodoptera frugiperda TaxID=7108 RepID=A0A9R0F1B4_SPOFR|nr:uncharacterized protein LOC118280922 isoform X4 [Spodoptera frugiperda]